jgi:hypothetical protein
MVLGEGIVQRFLTNTLSAYFDNVDRDNLSVAVVRGDVSLSQVHLRKGVMKHLGFKSLQLVNGSVGSLKAKVPWTKFGTAPIVFELENLFVLVESASAEDEYISALEVEAKMKESIEEIIRETRTEVEEQQPSSSSSWGGWLKSAGKLAKRLIDYMEIQIKIRNVHVRYTSDLFTAGATFESLSVVTTTQAAAPKILSLEKLAFYCNPLQDALEEQDAIKQGDSYVVEPVSGSVHLSFPSSTEIAIKGQFDSVQLQFSRDQLNSSIWAELKSILMATRPMDTEDQNISPKNISSHPSSETEMKIHISLALGRAVVRSYCLPATRSSEGSVDFVGEQLYVSGDISGESALEFSMRTLSVVNDSSRPIVRTATGGSDFVKIIVKNKEKNTDVQFRLGPVLFDFYPMIVGSLIGFLKSWSGGSGSPTSPKNKAESSPPSHVKMQFYWESMSVTWYPISGQGELFACSRMTASYISLDLLPTSEFIARGELGDFSIDHAWNHQQRPILSLATPSAGYLFKFFVRSFAESNPEYPGYATRAEFDLSAVQLVVVRTTLMRFWNYIFDGFLPGITGDLTAVSRPRTTTDADGATLAYVPPPLVLLSNENEDEDEDFKSVASDDDGAPTGVALRSEGAKSSMVLSPRMASAATTSSEKKKYSLQVTVGALELLLPVSMIADESDPLRIGLRKLTVSNEEDAILFKLEEVGIACMDRPLLVNGTEVHAKLLRDTSSMSIETVFGSKTRKDLLIDMDRFQFCRLCEVLDLNILANASDGIDDSRSPVTEAKPSAQAPPMEGEWLKFSFSFPSLVMKIDDTYQSSIGLAQVNLNIIKFHEPKTQIRVGIEGLSLSSLSVGPQAIGSIPKISVQVDSEPFSRSILVTVSEPLLEVHLGLLWGLRKYFFDDFSQYKSPSNILRSHRIEGPPEGWETILNVNLTDPRLCANDFEVHAQMLSFHQNWQSVIGRLLRKFVISSGLIKAKSDVIAPRMDFFYSSVWLAPANETTVKMNVEPINVRLSFSQLKALGRTVDDQLKSFSQANEGPGDQVNKPQEPSLLSVQTSSSKEIIISSLSLLVVNDFAVLEQTPLMNIEIRNLESSSLQASVRESLSVSLELGVGYFNKTTVSWEPLIEGMTETGGSNEGFVRIFGRRSLIRTGGEESVQAAIEAQRMQINITEALIKSLIENYRAWSRAQGEKGDGEYYSPFVVKNDTGEPEPIVVRCRPDLEFEIKNQQEQGLSGWTASFDSSHSRRSVSIDCNGVWSLPRVPIDKVGTYLLGPLVGRVSVTREGRKRLCLESLVLIRNVYGQTIGLQMLGDQICVHHGQVQGVPGRETHLRFGLLGGSTGWSGQVSVSDIWARANAKLWQIKLQDGNFMYLSGEKRSIVFQDRSADQLVINVFPPVRLRSTLPVLADYQLVAGSGPASAGTIGLNGEIFVTSLPLTGRLELALSLFDGKCVSSKYDPIIVWPPPTEELEQDASSKQFRLPISMEGGLELFLLYESGVSAVCPPELTIHTGQWLVGIDVPVQLGFVYDNDWSGPVPVTTPNGEKTFVVPLHARAKSISALLNRTRSESVLVDTIGASSQITLDAFDESRKVRVKQDLAVRVSSAPSGTVRDLPVKLTTVCPKYIVVNMLPEEVFVRQAGTEVGGVPVNPGEQVPFRWWTVERVPDQEPGGAFRDVVHRVLQVRTNSVWSEKCVGMAEIGEHLLDDIQVRAEVRMYHGGIFLVLTPVTGETNVGGGDSSKVEFKSAVFQVVLPELAVSVTGPVASRDSRRGELLLADIKNLLLTVSLTPVANELDLRMATVQIDDLRDEAKYPVVFGKAPAVVPKKNSPGDATPPPPPPISAIEVFAAWMPPCKTNEPATALNFESFLIKGANANLCIDFSLISDLTAMMDQCAFDPPVGFPYKFAVSMEQLPIGSLRIWSFKELLLAPLGVNLSFHPGTMGSNYSVLHRALSSMAAVERSPLQFQPLVLSKFRASRSNVLAVIAEHYKYELYREMRTIMGSAEAFGNPVGLISSVSVGVSDLFHEPLSAIREMQGPEDMAMVYDKTAKGAKSFFKNTAFGVANSFSKLAATGAQTLSILAEDDEFLAERKDFANKNRPSHFGDGVMVGAASFGRGVLSGLSGLVTKPVEGLEQEGLAGFAKGAVKGVGGFFLKPMAGFFDFAKSTAEGVVSSTKDAALDSAHIRLPRMLYSHDYAIRVIDSEHSLLKWYLGQLESMPPNFSYCAHVYDSQNGLLIASSAEHLVAADTRIRRLSLLVPLWRVLGVTTDLDHLVLSINVHVPPPDPSIPSSARGTSRIDLELSSVAIVKAVQQLVANAMEL